MAADRDTPRPTVRDWLHEAARATMTEDHGNPSPTVGQYEAALRAYDAALRLAPGHPEARLYKAGALDGLANAHARVGHHANTAAAFAESRRLMPDGAGGRSYPFRTLDRWCEALRALGRHADAVGVCDAYLDMARDEPGWRVCDAHLQRAASLMALDRAGEALAALDQGLAADPTHYQAAANRGIVLHNLGRYAEAVAAYDRALELGPCRALGEQPTADQVRHFRDLTVAAGCSGGDADAVP